VKCPKCDYLGFETGDRCKNCGYDFSLLSVAEAEPAEYEIHPASIDDVPVHMINDDMDAVVDDTFRISIATDAPLEEDPGLDLGIDFPRGMTSSPATANSALPLFARPKRDDDEPLITLPVAPRPPLAVRRTPDTPRLRAVPRPESPRPSRPPVLDFPDEVDRPLSPPPAQAQTSAQSHERVSSGAVTRQPGRAAARVSALLIDYVILFGIDAAVVYFTVRMAGLSPDEWQLLPVAPMVAFLGLLKVAYFYAFTAVGGQTIGKMAAGTCVVAENGIPLDAAAAMRRTAGGVLSFLMLGLGFLPALFGDRRALHDRLAGTRVVRLRSV